MVPLVSQVRYRSMCRYCGQKFSWRYFWVELLTGCVFLALYVRYYAYGSAELSESARTIITFAAFFYAAALVVIFFIDLEWFLIPDSTVLFAVVCGVAKDAYLISIGHRQLWYSVPGWPEAWKLPLPQSVLLCLVAFWALWQFAALSTAAMNREAMGAGDSLLLGAMGTFLLPWPMLALAFLCAVFLGAFGGILGLWLHERRTAWATVAAESSAAESPPPSAIATPVQPAQHPDDADPATSCLDETPPVESSTAEGLEPLIPSAAESAVFSEGAAAGESDAPELCNPAELLGSDAPDGGTPPSGTEQGRVVEPLAAPTLPPDSRWGRVLTVMGSWVGVGAIWFGGVVASAYPAAGVGVGLLGLALMGALLWFGIGMWKRGDTEWLPAMDALFEEDPGPRYIPFGPYLVSGTLLAMLFGPQLIRLYAERVMAFSPEVLRAFLWE